MGCQFRRRSPGCKGSAAAAAAAPWVCSARLGNTASLIGCCQPGGVPKGAVMSRGGEDAGEGGRLGGVIGHRHRPEGDDRERGQGGSGCGVMGHRHRPQGAVTGGHRGGAAWWCDGSQAMSRARRCGDNEQNSSAAHAVCPRVTPCVLHGAGQQHRKLQVSRAHAQYDLQKWHHVANSLACAFTLLQRFIASAACASIAHAPLLFAAVALNNTPS